MSLRLAAVAFAAVLPAAIAACQSSAPYGSPAYVAAVTGVAAAGAVGNAALGGCLAECTSGTVCNPVTKLCEHREAAPSLTKPATGTAGKHAPVTNASYPPGYEYDVPGSSAADAGCDPTSSDGGALSCDMDAAVPH